MLVMVPLPVQEMDAVPSPKYSMMDPVPPLVVKMPHSFKITSFGDVQPESLPVNHTPMSFGHCTSQKSPTMTSTASAPPTPTASIPSPPALGVCESVPIIRPPGKA